MPGKFLESRFIIRKRIPHATRHDYGILTVCVRQDQDLLVEGPMVKFAKKQSVLNYIEVIFSPRQYVCRIYSWKVTSIILRQTYTTEHTSLS